MPIDPAFADLMTQTVTLRRFNQRDEYSERSYGSPEELKAHIQGRIQDIRTKDGVLVTSHWTVWIFGTPGIKPEDELILPDGSSPPILDVTTSYDEDGPYYEKVMA